MRSLPTESDGVSRRACLTLALSGLAGLRTAPAAEAATMTTELVTTGLYLISGGGANTLLRFSANGLLLVDAKSPGNYKALMLQVRKTSKLLDMPVRALVLTGDSDDVAGNAAQFAAAQVQVVGQERALQRIASLHDGTAPGMLPAFGYDREHRLRFGGIEVELRHVGPARSDGDAIVVFADLKVAAIGHLVDPEPPRVDDGEGGNLKGWVDTLDAVLALDCRRYVPSSGPVLERADVIAYRSKVEAAMSAARRQNA